MSDYIRNITLQCDCLADAVAVGWMGPTEHDPTEFWYLEFYVQPNAQLPLKRRIQNAWRLLRGREPKHTVECTVLNREKAIQLRNFLNEVIDD